MCFDPRFDRLWEKIVKRVFLCIVFLFLAAGCQTATTGQGPIAFTGSVAANFHHYMNQGHPDRFAVSENGRASYYYYCPKNFFACRDSTDTEAIHGCEQRSAGVKCFIFARKRNVVWSDPGAFMRNHIQGDVALDGSEPVLFGQAQTNLRTYLVTGKGAENRAFAVNYHLTQNKLFGYGWAANKATEELAKQAALQDCQQRSVAQHKDNCKVYMVNEEKVWFAAN